MSIRACIAHTFYFLTQLTLPENFNVSKVNVMPVTNMCFYSTEIIVGITHYDVRFYARRNGLGEVIEIIPHSVEFSQ